MDTITEKPKRGRPPGARNQHPTTCGTRSANRRDPELEAVTWEIFRARCDQFLRKAMEGATA